MAIARIQLLRSDVAISVDLSWCILDDAALECLKGLPQLRKLDLSHTEVTDAGLEHLKGLRQLRTLDLSFTKIKWLLDPTERKSHGPQFVGLDADPVDGYAAGLGLGQQPEASGLGELIL